MIDFKGYEPIIFHLKIDFIFDQFIFHSWQ